MQNHKIKKVRLGSTGPNHWNYQHGHETLAAKQQRSEQSLRLLYLQDMGHELGMMRGKRTPGRKPVNFVKLNIKQIVDLIKQNN
jgi:hypothetical protein